jgi:hypothetical protein
MNRAIRLFCGVVLLVLLVPSAAFSAPPKGAVKLPNSKVVKKDGFFCGNVRSNTWVPGRGIAGGYFYSYQAERTNLRGQLKGASKSKRAKLRAKIDGLSALISSRSEQCVAGGGSNGGGGGSSSPGRALKFDFSGAVGLTLKNAKGAASLYSGQSSPESNLRKIDGSGQQSEALKSGSATVSRFLIAPNDKLYVLFESGTNLADTSKSGNCLLAEVSKTTGEPVCVENSLDSVTWQEAPKNRAVQFDDRGRIYYLGASSGRQVLRRNDAGSVTELINDNVSLNDFLVLADGRVLVAGTTNSTGAKWFRIISAQGSLETLMTAARPGFLARYPDNNVYIGVLQDNGTFNVRRFLTDAGQLEAKRWICRGVAGLEDPNDCYFNAIDFPDTWPAFSGWGGAIISSSHTTLDRKVFAVAGDSGAPKVLMQYYPTVTQPSTLVKNVSVVQSVISHIIIAGVNQNEKNVLSLFNTSDNSEIQLIGPDNEIEIYHLNYVASSNKIMFDGLRFSDNKYVIGQYDLNSMTFSASQTGSTKLVDFQTF